MANAIYPIWKGALLQATAGTALNGSGTTGVYAALGDSGVRGYNAADDFFSDMSSALYATALEIGATKTYTGGTFDGADVNFTSVPGTVTYEFVLLYVRNAGANTTWYLVAYLDNNIANLPVTSNGGNILLTWDAGGIFQL